jgi:acyl-CoA synthetase (AMP-forming)/AMP-acid ligase II
MLTHYGLITNVVQTTTFENFAKAGHGEVATGAVPFSHSYGLTLGHMAVWRGDTIVTFPRFDMQLMLSCIPKYLIERLYLVGIIMLNSRPSLANPLSLTKVPPILAAMAANPFLFQLFNFTSVRSVVTGAAALSLDLAEKLLALQPKWQFLHAYGKLFTWFCV